MKYEYQLNCALKTFHHVKYKVKKKCYYLYVLCEKYDPFFYTFNNAQAQINIRMQVISKIK